MNKGSYIIITFKEWANWIEYSLLRADLNRVKIYNGTPTSMQNVFSAAPDITFIEDNEFVVVSLANNYPRHINLPENSVSCYLSIDSVEHFYAVSERGARLLAYTAANLKTNLSTDIEIAQGWDAFCRQQQAVINREKSIKFCKIIDLGLTDEKIQLIDINDTNNFFKYLGIFRSFNNKPEYLERFSGTKAYGGMATRFLVKQLKSKIGTSVIEKLETFSAEISYEPFYKDLIKLQTRDDLTQCFFNIKNIALIKEKVGSEAIIENNNKNIEPIPLLALSLYLHYEMLLNSQIEINLNSLKFDLEILKHCYAEQSEDTHITVAYLLGELYPDIMINSLYAAKTNKPSVMNMEYLESLKPKLPVLDQEKFDALTKNLIFIIEIPQDETVAVSDAVTEPAPPSPAEENSVVLKNNVPTPSKPCDYEANNSSDTSSLIITQPISPEENSPDKEICTTADHPSNSTEEKIQEDYSKNDIKVENGSIEANQSTRKHNEISAIMTAMSELNINLKTWSELATELKKKKYRGSISIENTKNLKDKLRELDSERKIDFSKNLSAESIELVKILLRSCI